MAATTTSEETPRTLRHRPRGPACRGRPDTRRAGAAGAEPVRPVRAVGQPRGQPARLHRRHLRPAAGRRGHPRALLAAALTAIVVGTVLGTLPVALAGLPGVRTGAPAMVLLRGLFGARLSYLPTVLNIAQCVGWGVFELVTIATAAHTVAPALPKTGYVLIAGAATALLTIRPLGAIRVLRKYATGAVLIVLCYLFVQLIRHPLPPLHARFLVRILGGDRHRGRGRHLLGPARRRLHPALPQPAGRLHRRAGRLQRHPGALLRHRAARPGHRGARRPGPDLRRVHRAAARRRSASPSSPRASSTRPSPTSTPPRCRPRTCARCGTAGCWPA